MSFTDEVNGCFIGEALTPKNCYDLWDVLFKYGHVNHLVTTIDQPDTAILYLREILNAISSRTLVFGKPFERLTASTLMLTNPDLGICPIPMSFNTISRGISALKKAGLLISFRSAQVNDWYLGLDIHNIVIRLSPWVKQGTATKIHRVGKSQEIIAEMEQSEQFMLTTKKMQLLQGAKLPQTGVTKEIERMCASLAELLPQVEVRDKARLEKKEAKTESVELLKSGAVAKKEAEAFLINWKKLVIDSELYPSYDMRSEVMDNKMLACVKAFLRAEYAAGVTWEELKEELVVLIDGWGRIPKKHRKLFAISTAGKPYSIDLGDTPDFKQYWSCRSSIRRLCLQYAAISMPSLTADKIVTDNVAETQIDEVDDNASAFDF